MSNSNVILPKLNGADIELGNFVLGLPGFETGSLAARALLAEIEGLPRSRDYYHPTCSTHSRGSCHSAGEEPNVTRPAPPLRRTGDGSSFPPTAAAPTSTSTTSNSAYRRS